MKINLYVKNKEIRSLATYIVLAFVRIVFIFIPQYGYIHPDEFFQSSEVVTGKNLICNENFLNTIITNFLKIGEVFDLEATKTWEFNNTLPLRSYAIPYIYLKIPMTIFKFIAMYSKILFNVDIMNSYGLLIFPRIIVCMLSFVNDFSVWRICKSNNIKNDIRLLTLASSWVMLTFGIRSFSNTLEMTLCSMILCLVSECMVFSNTVIYQSEFLEEKYEKAKKVVEKVKYFKMRMSLPKHSFKSCFILSTLCVIGIFNRPTFILFGFPIIFHWMIRGFGSKSVTFTDFNLRMLFFIISGLPAFAIIVTIDSLYYGYLSLAQIYILDIGMENFLVTPVNFIRYNINPENTAQHGEHPKLLHILVNIPLLYNILGVIAVGTFGMMIYKFCKKEFQSLPQTQSFVSLMTSAVFVPISMLSLFNHQEARFLIPVTVPLIMLHAPKVILGVKITSTLRESQWSILRSLSNVIPLNISGRAILRIWYVMNIVFALFFGFVHQGGVIQVANHFSKYHPIQPSTTQIHLVTSHLYMMPQSLLVIPSSDVLYTNPKTGQKYRKSKRFFTHELGGMEISEVVKNVKTLLDAAEVRSQTTMNSYEMFVAIPTSLAYEFNSEFNEQYKYIIVSEEKVYYPHLSTEALPSIAHLFHSCDKKEFTDSCEKGETHSEWLSFESLWRKVLSVTRQLGVVIYKIEVKHKTEKFM